MNLRDKINNDLKEAMKAKDSIRRETLRSIRSLIIEFDKSGSNPELTPEVEISILTSAAKKRKEAAEQYEKAGRMELAEKESKELEIIQSYLPEQLTGDKLMQEIKRLAEECGAKSKADFRILMPLAAKTLKGKADGKEIKEKVEEYLS